MNRGLILILTACTLAAAMAPRDRRAVNREKEVNRLGVQSTTEKSTFCEETMPCQWSLYEPGTKDIAMNITNAYCTCAVGSECQKDGYDTLTDAAIYRCRSPKQAKEITKNN